MNYYGAKEMAESFRTVRKNTIQVAEDIPEEKYSFRAAPDTMSVGEMLAHLASTPHWAQQCHFIEKKTTVDDGRLRQVDGRGRRQVQGADRQGADCRRCSRRTATLSRSRSSGMTDAQLGERVAPAEGDQDRASRCCLASRNTRCITARSCS